MFLFMIPVLLLATNVRSQHFGGTHPESAASEAQIRFAIENKYDDTGPGAKGPENAYKTFKNLDDALVGYIDDPDTKLSEHDKLKGLQKLYKNQYSQKSLYQINSGSLIKPVSYIKTSIKHEQSRIPVFPKAENFALKQDQVKIPILPKPENFGLQHENIQIPSLPKLENFGLQHEQVKLSVLPTPEIGKDGSFLPTVPRMKLDNFRLHKFQPIKGSPLNLAHFTRMPSADSSLDNNNLNGSPNYSYSYGVHDKMTGDSKSAHETRDGDKVTGYYTFLDPDGKQRTVHYTADDKQGFRAIVRRTVTNSQ